MQRLVVRVEGAESYDGVFRQHDAASVCIARSEQRKEISDDLREIGMYAIVVWKIELFLLLLFIFCLVLREGFNAKDVRFVIF